MGSSLSSCSSSSSCSSLEDTMNSKIFYPPSLSYDIKKLNSKSCTMLSTQTLSKQTVHLAHIIPNNNNKTQKYIIMSSGNGADVFGMIDYGQYLANNLNVSVILYDYLGYGHSTGSPSETGCYESISAVISYVKNELHVLEKDITLIGQSLGTGITIDYVSKNNWKSPIILISPYKSIISVVYDSSIVQLANPIDKFKTLSKLGNVFCPVKIFHGDADELINVSHGKTIYEKLNNKTFEPTWLKGVGHNDILGVIDLKEVEKVVRYESATQLYE